MTLKLSMTCGPYDRARALIDGSVKPEGIELAVSVNADDVDRQQRAARGDQLDLLAKGDLDAGITTEVWAPNRHPDIDFLFPDHGAREREYFRRTRCFPILHMLLIRDSVLEHNPWAARSLYDAWEASK